MSNEVKTQSLEHLLQKPLSSFVYIFRTNQCCQHLEFFQRSWNFLQRSWNFSEDFGILEILLVVYLEFLDLL